MATGGTTTAKPKATTAKKATATTAKATATEKAKKVKKEAPSGMTTAQFAERLSEILGRDVTPTALRRVLRTDDGGYNDKEYSRYSLQEADLERIADLMRAGTTSDGTRKRGRKAKAEAPEAEAPEELEALDEELEDVIEELGEEDESEDEELEDVLEDEEEEILDEDEEDEDEE